MITFLGPLATGLLGYLVLGEPFTLRETFGGIVSLAGVVLIARPAFIFGRKAADSDLDHPLTVDSVNPTNGIGQNTTNQIGSAIVKHLMQNLTATDAFRRSSNSTLVDVADGVVTIDGVTEKQRLFAVG